MYGIQGSLLGYFLSVQPTVQGIFLKRTTDQVTFQLTPLHWLLVVPFCVQLDLINLPRWSSFDGLM